jgi:hypothetical protein
MPKVQVWNDNVHPFTQRFKGEKVTIAAQSWIWMDQDEAHQFEGSFSPPILDVDGNGKAEGFKMIRVVKAEGAPAEDKPKSAQAQANVCQACRFQAANAKDLEEHQKASHASQALTDELAEKELKARKKTG